MSGELPPAQPDDRPQRVVPQLQFAMGCMCLIVFGPVTAMCLGVVAETRAHNANSDGEWLVYGLAGGGSLVCLMAVAGMVWALLRPRHHWRGRGQSDTPFARGARTPDGVVGEPGCRHTGLCRRAR